MRAIRPSTVSSAGQRSSSGMLSAGKRRSTVPAVTFTSTPRSIARRESVAAASGVEQLHAEQQAAAARVRARAFGCSAAKRCEPLQHARAERRGARDEAVLFDHAQHRVRRRAGERVARVGAAVIAERHGLRDVLGAQEARDREAAAESLAERDRRPGTTASCSSASHLPGAADAGLDLVEHEQRAGLARQLAQAGEVAGRRDVDAAFALHRLDHERGGVRVDRAARGVEVAERARSSPPAGCAGTARGASPAR